MNEIMNNQVRRIIIEALEGGECTRQKILEKINQGLPENEPLTTGTISGIIKTMKESGEIKIISRGVYQRGDGNQNRDIKSKVEKLLDRFLKDLNRAYTVNVLRMEDYDQNFVIKTQSIVNKFDAEIKNVFSVYDDMKECNNIQEVAVTEKQETGKVSVKVGKENKK